MENDILFRGRNFRNAGPRKIEAKFKTGSMLHRAALGDIHNKPSLFSKNSTKNPVLKKNPLPVAAKVKEERRILKQDKENECENYPANIPHEFCTKENESMDIDHEDNILLKHPVAFSSLNLAIRDIDSEDEKNPQLVSAYVKEIYLHLWKLEDEYPIQANYLEGQKITSRMRGILIDWLVQVHQRFTLLQETLYLTVAIIDRYLQVNKTVTKDKLQLIGVTALFISSKYEEMYIPEIGDFAYITDKAFSKKDIRVMEVDMLKTLKYYISFPLPLHFLRRNSKAGQVDAAHHTLAKFIMELTLVEYSFCQYKASLIAAAALFLSMRIVGDGTKWNEVMAFYSNYNEEQILPVIYEMSALIIKSATCKQQAIRSKYKSSKFLKISDISGLKPTARLLKNYAEKVTTL